VIAVDDEGVGEIASRRPAQGRAPGLVVLVVEIAVGRRAVGIALPIGDAAGEAQRKAFGERNIDRTLDDDRVVVAEGRVDIAFEPVGRIVRSDQHRAARGVAPEQGALRPAQHLDRGQIEEGRVGAVRTRLDHLGEIDADRRVERDELLELNLAADGEARHAATEAALAGGEAGNRAGQIDHLLDRPAGELVARNGGDRDRNFLEALLATACGDHDVLQPVVRLRCGGCGLGAAFLRLRCAGTKRQTAHATEKTNPPPRRNAHLVPSRFDGHHRAL
jgi:hypothetical protein